ncbi:hypothetical protein Tco_0201819 [Tanacetum coccineum]
MPKVASNVTAMLPSLWLETNSGLFSNERFKASHIKVISKDHSKRFNVKEVPEVVHCSDDESVKNEADINVVDNTVNNEGEESDSEAVSDTFFGDNGDAQEHDNEVDQNT